MPRTKRKDKSRAVLRTGESQRADGTYQFRWTDSNHKRFCVYAKTLDELRYKEEQIKKDKSDGIKTEARYTTVNEVYELWKELKRGLKNNTFENYKYMYETFVRHQIGSKTVSSLKKTDIKRFYNYLTDERQLKPSTIDSIHTVLHQSFNPSRTGVAFKLFEKYTRCTILVSDLCGFGRDRASSRRTYRIKMV